jgi:DedD protein
MAEPVVTPDELALRRRARRRLVGAVAIALVVVVVLPMLFDSEPKPLGPEVDINIPTKDAPFDTAPVLAQPAQVQQPEAQPAEPTQPPAPVLKESSTGLDAAKSEVAKSEVAKPEVTKPALNESKVKPEAKADQKPLAVVAAPTEKPKLKPDGKLEIKPDAKPVIKPVTKPDSAFATQGYFLQLGAFASESNANALKTKASNAGFNVVMTHSNGQFRVRVGPIQKHEAALVVQAKLKAKGFRPVLLGP